MGDDGRCGQRDINHARRIVHLELDLRKVDAGAKRADVGELDLLDRAGNGAAEQLAVVGDSAAVGVTPTLMQMAAAPLQN